MRFNIMLYWILIHWVVSCYITNVHFCLVCFLFLPCFLYQYWFNFLHWKLKFCFSLNNEKKIYRYLKENIFFFLEKVNLFMKFNFSYFFLGGGIKSRSHMVYICIPNLHNIEVNYIQYIYDGCINKVKDFILFWLYKCYLYVVYSVASSSYEEKLV